MPVVRVGSVLPKQKRTYIKPEITRITNKQNKEHKVINSFEFHAGFVPKTTQNDPAKVQHFIDSLI